MSLTLAQPGVYIQELEPDVRTLRGVPTSIVAFIGRARRGLVDTPVRVQGYGEFVRLFGGLWDESPMSYAVSHFFLNGGGDALIVRVHHPSADDARDRSTVSLPVEGGGTLQLEASSPGAWGSRLRVRVTHPAVDDPNLFHLTVQETDGRTPATVIAEEKLLRLSLDPAGQRFITDVLVQESGLVRMAPGELPGRRPADGTRATVLLAVEGEGALQLEASANLAGTLGNRVQVSVTHPGADPSLFDLVIQITDDADPPNTTTEDHAGLSMDPQSPRFVAAVLDQESALVGVRGAIPVTRPVAVDDAALSGGGAVVFVPFVGGDDGAPVGGTDIAAPDLESQRRGLYALDNADLFNLLCIPPFADTNDVDQSTWDAAVAYCVRRRAVVLVDPPAAWDEASDVPANITAVVTRSPNAALYFPRIRAADPLRENRPRAFAPSGVVAGVIARTDAARGVWKAPAGQDATLLGVRELTVRLTDGQNGLLNPRGVNCLRTFPAAGRVVWGARTLMGDDDLASQWTYLPVRRTALFIEESLYRGSQWVVFEPNDEPLWSQIRLSLGSFMHGLFRQGAFQGTTPQQAYFVKCDSETTTQADIDRGIVNIVVGFAPLKPAEFVVIQIQQITRGGE